MLRITSEPRIVEIDPSAPPPPRIIVDASSFPRRVATPRPKGVHTKHLTELDRFRVRTLYYDACLSKVRIHQITGYSMSQIRTAVRAKTAAVGKRPGRPQKGPKGRGRRCELNRIISRFLSLTMAHPANIPPIAKNREPSPDDLDEQAELIRQAREYFAQMHPSTSQSGERGEEGDDDDDEGEESDEEANDTAASGALSGRIPASSMATAALEWGLPTTTIAPPTEEAAIQPSPPPRVTFSDLPSDIRTHIWRCVMSTSPAHEPPSRSWALTVLPKEPWLELGKAPPNVKIDNPPWSCYVDARHVPAAVLTRVNREARAVVLERCTPVLVPKVAREASSSIPLFVWIDRKSDIIHYVDGEPRDDSFELAGKCAYPELYQHNQNTSS